MIERPDVVIDIEHFFQTPFRIRIFQIERDRCLLVAASKIVIHNYYILCCVNKKAETSNDIPAPVCSEMGMHNTVFPKETLGILLEELLIHITPHATILTGFV